ncbi:hypothetical protein J132_07016 [Termitomyces sp. J132]|nr:hypothetical protein J132_07016 [Termitomyces sp. J132]
MGQGRKESESILPFSAAILILTGTRQIKGAKLVLGARSVRAAPCWSSSLSPAPETGSLADSPRKEDDDDPARADQPSRLSTPLSELSPPPPDHDDDPAPPPGQQQMKHEELAHQDPPKPAPTPSIEWPATPTPASASNDPKVVSILDLNSELLKVCMELQSRGISLAEPRYSIRLQSNLTWLAAAADHSRAGNHSNVPLPSMDPPPSLDFGNMERIHQLYSELPSIFAKEITRRQQPPLVTNGNTALKRGASEELSASEIAMKRRNTGDGIKPSMPSSGSMPPPSTIPMTPMNPSTNPNHFALPISNGTPTPMSNPNPLPMSMPNTNANPNSTSNPVSPQHGEAQAQAQMGPLNPMAAGLIPNPTDAQLAAASMGGMGGGMGGGMVSGMGGAMLDPNMQQQLLRVLQNPNHPFLQYMLRNVPNFENLSIQQQMQKMMMMQAQLQRQQQAQQQMGHGQMSHMRKSPMGQMHPSMQSLGPQGGHNANMASSNGVFSGGGGMGGPHPVSPIPPQSPMVPPNGGMFGMDGMGGGAGGMGGGGGMSGGMGGAGGMDMRGLPNNMNMNSLQPTPRQLMLMQQSRVGGGAGGNVGAGPGGQMPGGGVGVGGPGMMMNSQQQQFIQEQNRIRQEQQHRMVQQHAQQQQQQAGAGGMMTPGSPMVGDPTFPALRSNPASIPGIARSTRSPSDGAVSPMTPRAGPGPGSGLLAGSESDVGGEPGV